MRISDWSSDVCSSDLIGMQPFGMRARDVEADHRAPGMAHDEELPLSIMLEKVGNEFLPIRGHPRSEEHTSELQSLMRISYAVFCLKKKKTNRVIQQQNIFNKTTTKTQRKCHQDK